MGLGVVEGTLVKLSEKEREREGDNERERSTGEKKKTRDARSIQAESTIIQIRMQS